MIVLFHTDHRKKFLIKILHVKVSEYEKYGEPPLDWFCCSVGEAIFLQPPTSSIFLQLPMTVWKVISGTIFRVFILPYVLIISSSIKSGLSASITKRNVCSKSEWYWCNILTLYLCAFFFRIEHLLTKTSYSAHYITDMFLEYVLSKFRIRPSYDCIYSRSRHEHRR